MKYLKITINWMLLLTVPIWAIPFTVVLLLFAFISSWVESSNPSVNEQRRDKYIRGKKWFWE